MTAGAAHRNTGDATPLTVTTGAGIDLDELRDCATVYASVEDVSALLGIGAAALQAVLDDPESAPARVWRQGRAQARVNLRRAQFAQIGKNATLAIYLGKEILGQDGAGPAGPVTFVVDTGIRRDAAD